MRKVAQTHNVLLIGGAVMAIADTIMDVTATATVEGRPSPIWLLFAGAITAAMILFELITAKTMKAQTSVSIAARILDRWETVQHEFGIDPDEARAEITQFRHVLDQIELAETARQGASNEATRALLDERVTILMRETLGPLAAELDYLKSEEGRIHTTVTDTFITITQQRQHEQDVAAELLACTPI